MSIAARRVFRFMKAAILVLIGKIVCRLEDFLSNARAQYLTSLIRKNGSKGNLGSGVVLGYPENIYIGEGSFINGGMVFASDGAKIIVGKNCMISYNVHLRTDMHIHSDLSMPMKEQGSSHKSIVIEDDVWIGYGSQVMSGVTVGTGSIIGAGAVVTRDIPPWTVWGGVPARFIRNRKEPEEWLQYEI